MRFLWEGGRVGPEKLSCNKELLTCMYAGNAGLGFPADFLLMLLRMTGLDNLVVTIY